MGRGVLLVCAAAFGSGAVACGLTASFAGLQGGGVDAGIDASGLTPAPDASSAPDAGAVSDSGVDAATDAGPGFCASLVQAVKLCDDFDEGQPVEAGWGAPDFYGAETASIDTASSFSPPASFLSAIDPAGAPSSARLLQTMPIDSPHVHVEFEMLLTPSDQGTLELCVIHEVVADGTTYGLYYQEVNGALEVELRALASDGTTFDQTWPIGAPPASWTHVGIDMEIGDAGSFTVQEDDAAVTQSNVPTSTPGRTALFVELGLYSYTPASGQARFDNAIVDWH